MNEPEPSPNPTDCQRPRGHRVLVIEDSRLAAEAMRDALELGSHTVDVARTGSEGIDKARSFLPDVVLCDVGLPDMDGYQVARTLRADRRLCSAFLVALTGHTLHKDEIAAAEAGFDRHVAKPLGLRKLEQLMADAPTQGVSRPGSDGARV